LFGRWTERRSPAGNPSAAVSSRPPTIVTACRRVDSVRSPGLLDLTDRAPTLPPKILASLAHRPWVGARQNAGAVSAFRRRFRSSGSLRLATRFADVQARA